MDSKYKKYIYSNINKIISLTRAGNGIYKTSCLKDKSHEMYYSKSKNEVYCPFCNMHGDFINSSAELMNISPEELVFNILKKKFNIANEFMTDLIDEVKEIKNKKDRLYKLYEKAMKFYESEFENSPIAKNYVFNKRNISKETAAKCHIGYAPKGNKFMKTFAKEYTVQELHEAGLLGHNVEVDEYYDMFTNRVMFPIWNKDNQVVAFGGRTLGNAKSKYLNSPTTPIFSKYTCLYGVNWLNPNKKYPYILCCEGYMDAVSLIQQGIENVVSDLGVALSRTHINTLKKYTDDIVLMLDGDKAGQTGMKKAIFGTGEVSTLTLPDNLDPDEFIQKYSAEVLVDYIERHTLNWEQSVLESLKTETGNIFENLIYAKSF